MTYKDGTDRFEMWAYKIQTQRQSPQKKENDIRNLVKVSNQESVTLSYGAKQWQHLLIYGKFFLTVTIVTYV